MKGRNSILFSIFWDFVIGLLVQQFLLHHLLVKIN